MAWGVAAAGLAMQVLGGVQSAKSNIHSLEDQASTSNAQGVADEATVRRNSQFELGKQAAAIAENGGGYGGTNAGVMKDSHVAAEMDALNYRYRGLMRSYGLLSQAKQISKQSPLMAGGQLLAGSAQIYGQQQVIKAAAS